ncbi:unnamed protein product [Arabidopsis arenosa]|uniref:TPX2 C-terminal domain-containing protein n=1 Tax=Arabidopsis arenosa TaxID=38785 RepID=A0A8S1ZSX8_ARAAE|nr:unnamed protein product [Arabidopsis arenosa]
MESTNAKHETLVMEPISFQSKAQEISKFSENSNPNVVSHSTPLAKSAKSSKSSAQKNPKSKPNLTPAVFSPRNRIRERRFVVVKKNSSKEKKDSASVDCKCGAKTNSNMKKCVCIAYETLRASQEEFFNNRRESESEIGESSQNLKDGDEQVEIGDSDEIRVSSMKRRREKVLEEARMSLPEFATNLGLEQPHASVSSSWDNSDSSLNSNGGRRGRRNSLDSSASMGSRRSKKKQIKVTSLKPFKLRTEERGRMKEEEFAKKLHEMTLENEKMRIPIAQGLPWTTDEPENLVKPHVKDITIPVDLKLHSDIRAVERAEFDYQVAEKINLIEQYKTERERQQKLAEEEEIRRLRKELVPKAQPMPYFDRPFIPKRSNKHPTIPRDPKFNIPQHKKIRCCSTSSWSDTGSYMSDLLYQQDL